MALLKDHEEILLTGEELLHRPDLGPCELVNGRVVPLPPPEPDHGEIEGNIGSEIRAWARPTRRGKVCFGDVGIYIRRNPDTVRAPDILFISTERHARYRGSGYFDVAPELVVEVLSPSDRWSDIMEKIEDYFSAGVDRVWIADLRLRRVSTYRSPTEVQHFQEGEVLTDEELLPGFRLDVSEIFRL